MTYDEVCIEKKAKWEDGTKEGSVDESWWRHRRLYKTKNDVISITDDVMLQKV